MDSMRAILGRGRKTCVRVVTFLFLPALLGACGQKGPLYLPADPPPATKAVPAAPAASAPNPDATAR